MPLPNVFVLWRVHCCDRHLLTGRKVYKLSTHSILSPVHGNVWQVPSDFATPADLTPPYTQQPASGGSGAAEKQEALEDYEEDLMARIERTLAEASRTLHLHSNLAVSGAGAGAEDYKAAFLRSDSTASDDVDARMLC